MDDKRISKIDGYKGNDDGFARLYAAIWKKALEDELRYQKVRLLIDTSERLFSGLLKYDITDRNSYTKVSRLVGLEYGMQGIKFVEEIEMLIEESTIKKAVQAKVYRETEDWPDNHRRDAEFEKVYIQIRDGILDSFSGRRCANE